MGWFGLGRRKDVLDLTEKYKREQEKLAEVEEESQTPVEGGLGFLGQLASSVKKQEEAKDYIDVSSDVDEKRKRLTKRIMDMTEKIEELSNQIYHLQQRVELLEKKSGVGGY